MMKRKECEPMMKRTIIALELSPGYYFTGNFRGDGKRQPDGSTQDGLQVSVVWSWGQTSDLYCAGDYSEWISLRYVSEADQSYNKARMIELVKQWYEDSNPRFVQIEITGMVIGDV